MIFKNIAAYCLFCLNIFFSIGFVFAETLESVEMENKSLQIEIDSIKVRIENLENHPSDDPVCADIKSELDVARSEAKDADNVYATGTETIKSLDGQISNLESKERELDAKIKKHKSAQVTTGVLGGVLGLTAGGIGLWSHLEKNKIEKGEYTDPSCVSKIFDKERSQIFSKFELDVKNRGNVGSETLNLLADVGSDCLSCCPGKSDECEKSSNNIKDELERKLIEFNKNNPKIESDIDRWKERCKEIMNYGDNLKKVYDSIGRYVNFDSKDKNSCYEYAEKNYGEIAIKKTNAKYKEEKNKYHNDWLVSECRKEFCSEDSFNNSYPSACVSECQKVNFSMYVPDEILCKDVISKYGRIGNLREACSFINGMSNTSNEKDRCFNYIIQAERIFIDISNISGLVWTDKLANCFSVCECNYPVYPTPKNIQDAQNMCRKQCEDNIKAPKPEVRTDLKSKQVEVKQLEIEKHKNYCESVDNEIRSACLVNPYRFENIFGKSSRALFTSKKELLQSSGEECESFKSELQNKVKNYVCNCYLGFPVIGNTSKAIHFDCISVENNAKSFVSNWKSNKTEMKLTKSRITEQSCIELYNKHKSGGQPTAPSNCN